MFRILLLLCLAAYLHASPHLSARQDQAFNETNQFILPDTGFWIVAGTQLRRIGNLELDCSGMDTLHVRWDLQQPDWILRNTHLFVGPSNMAPQGSFLCYPNFHNFELLMDDQLNRVFHDEFSIPLNATFNGAPLLDENFCVHVAAHADVARLTGNLANLDVIQMSPEGCCHETIIHDGNFVGEELQDSFFVTIVDGEELKGWSVIPEELNFPLDEELCTQEIYSFDPMLLSLNLIEMPEHIPHANYLINNANRYLDTPLSELLGEESNVSAEQDQFCSWADIQIALWRLLNGRALELNESTPECVDFIFDDAMTNGEGFIPCCGGDFLAFLLPTEENATTATNESMCTRRDDLHVTAVVRHVTECDPVVQTSNGWGAVRPGGPERMDGTGELLWGEGTQSFLISKQDICAGLPNGNGGASEAAPDEGNQSDEQLGAPVMSDLERAFQWESTQPIFIRFCFPDRCRPAMM